MVDEFKAIRYEKAGNVSWITLNRPEAMNALNRTVLEELTQALTQARDDKDTYIIAVTGAGDKAFSAGGDVLEHTKLFSVDQLERHGRQHPFVLIREIPKPVIAMVNGLALGGGCELVQACDIAIASENAQFGQPEIRVGVIPVGGGTQLLPRFIGEKRAKDLIFTGRFITAAEALQIGLVNQVVPHDKLKEATDKYLGTLLRRSPVILRLAKLAVNRSLETPLSAGLAAERDLFALCFGTDDQKEGARAFIEKREPNYKGR